MKTIAAASLALALALAGATAVACEHGGDGPKNPEKHLDRMTEELGLSPAQREQVKVLMEEHHAKRAEARAAMHEDMKASMANVLTPEQMTKLDAMHEARKERKEMRKERREERKAERDARRDAGSSKE